jgi:hypothetical protein
MRYIAVIKEDLNLVSKSYLHIMNHSMLIIIANQYIIIRFITFLSMIKIKTCSLIRKM